jgi:ankyrin repeat protein
VEAASELLDLGADVNAENERFSTPLHFAAAAKKRTREMCELLLDAGADLGLSDLQGRLPHEIAKTDDIRYSGHALLAALAGQRGRSWWTIIGSFHLSAWRGVARLVCWSA